MKIIVLSVISIVVGHQIVKYIKDKYLDTNATKKMLRESKKMYEDIARALNLTNQQKHIPNKKGNNVKICEEDNIVNEIPNRDSQSNTTSLEDLDHISRNTNTNVEPDMNSMQDELTNYMNTLSQ
jgi:hypothetical protein